MRPGVVEHALERFAHGATRAVGSGWGFACAAGIVIAWAALGPLFGFSDTWQLVINTGTTIVTFLVVFLIQRAQNKDALSLQLKLNEIVAALQGASNRLIDAEDLPEPELKTLHRHYRTLATLAKADERIGKSHSVEEARTRHAAKVRSRSSKRPQK
jgi:low affinity Fe/Cu permease